MEPLSILIWLAITFTAIIGVMLTIALYRLIRILTAFDRILSYVDHIRELMQMWESWPLEIGKKILSKIIDHFAK